MKKLILIFSIIFFSISSFCQSSTLIKVNNALEFVEAIGSNRTIQLEGNAIYLSDISSSKSGSNYRFDEEFDGHELVIFDVSNLKIMGLGLKPVKIVTKPQYGDVIVFNNCNDITIENIDAGHGPEIGQCAGGVLNFIDTKNINIYNSVLFGSGIEGITALKVKNLKCNNSIIKGCSSDIMTLDSCEEIGFNGCDFIENSNYEGINLLNSSDITFNNCSVTDNSGSILSVQNCMNVNFNDCKINNNSTNDCIIRIGNSLNINFFKCFISNNKGFCNSTENNKLAYEMQVEKYRAIKENNEQKELSGIDLSLISLGLDSYDVYILDIIKSIVYFNECSFNLNSFCYFSRATESFLLNNCFFRKNNFILGNFPD